jgi:hypothetical protein
MKVGRHDFDLTKLRPITLCDMERLEDSGMQIKDLDMLSAKDLLKFVTYFLSKANQHITEDDVRELPTTQLKGIMEKLNAEPDPDFLAS